MNHLRIASVGIASMENTTELTDIEMLEAIKKNPKLANLHLEENCGALVCPICYNLIRLTHLSDKILWCECYKCAPQHFITINEYGRIVAEYNNRMAATEKIAA